LQSSSLATRPGEQLNYVCLDDFLDDGYLGTNSLVGSSSLELT
jgi:hypothetical protein